jgi:hypothetical protein
MRACSLVPNLLSHLETMIRKPLLCAAALVFWFPAASAADAPIFEKQSSGIDSALIRCAALPETRMKEVAPFDNVAKQTLAANSEIVSVIRTNSKGIVVNCVMRPDGRSDNENTLHRDVSAEAWFSAVSPAMKPFYGPLRKADKRAYRIFSRPVTVSVATGGKRFGGVVAITFSPASRDERAVVKKTAATPKVTETGQPQRAAAAPQDPRDKQGSEPDTGISPPDGAASGYSARGHGHETAFLRIAGIAAGIVVVFCLWLIISTLRKRKKLPVASVERQASSPVAEAIGTHDAVFESSPQGLDAPGTDTPAAEGSPPAYTVIPPIQPAAPVPVQEPETAGQESADEVQIEVPAGVPAKPDAADEIAAEIREELRTEMRAKITNDERDELYREELESVTAAIRQQLVEKEMAGLIEKLRQQFASELHQHLVETMSGSLEEQERAAVAREVAEKVRTEEYEAILSAERRALSERVKAEIAEKESADLTAQIREKLKSEIYAAVLKAEEEVFIARAREELASDVRSRLIEAERDGIAGQQRRKLEAELYDDVSQRREEIRESVVREITEEERLRAGSGLRQEIAEQEKNRILAEESPGIRDQIRKELRDEEAENLRRTIRDEIYSETVQAIKGNLEDKYRSVVEEKIGELRASLSRKAKADFSAAIAEDYDRLIDRAEELSSSLTNIEALQSLSQTITLLTDEKKKYKYLNLNAAQTESLLEYLRRVHNRFNIFFDKVDESVRELMLGLGSVRNKLSHKE